MRTEILNVTPIKGDIRVSNEVLAEYSIMLTQEQYDQNQANLAQRDETTPTL